MTRYSELTDEELLAKLKSLIDCSPFMDDVAELATRFKAKCEELAKVKSQKSDAMRALAASTKIAAGFEEELAKVRSLSNAQEAIQTFDRLMSELTRLRQDLEMKSLRRDNEKVTEVTTTRS